MDSDCTCEYLEWDSQFFGRRIARVSVPRLTGEVATDIENWCSGRRIDCLYFLVDCADQATIDLAQEGGFRAVDIRITLSLTRPHTGHEGDGPSGLCVRAALESDIPALRSVARSAHRDSRFYHDGHFPAKKCNELYETWVDKSCHGLADKVFVADAGCGAEGYLTCHLEPTGTGRIGLVGVAERMRGQGVGQCMVVNAIRWFVERGAREISVVTQGRNIPAQRLYQKSGFRTQSAGIWFHRWFSRDL